MKPLITFDMDGVLAGGPIVAPEEQSNPQIYARMPIMCRCGIELVKRLLAEGRCYVGIVTARRCEKAETTTREWLRKVGVPDDELAFVLTGIPTMAKAQTIKELNALVHFDDRMEVAQALGPQGCVGVAECAYNAEEMWEQIHHRLYELKLINNYQQTFGFGRDVHGETSTNACACDGYGSASGRGVATARRGGPETGG